MKSHFTAKVLTCSSMVITVCTSPAIALSMRCEITAKQQCSPAEGCRSVAPKAFNLIDLSAKTYSRCDQIGCDEYEASQTAGGQYVVIDVPGRGMVAKLDMATLNFLEVVTLATEVAYVSWGKCSVV